MYLIPVGVLVLIALGFLTLGVAAGYGFGYYAGLDEADRSHVKELERLDKEALLFIRREKFLAAWVEYTSAWEKPADAALAAKEKP